MKALLGGLRALGPARLATMAAVALGMLGMLALMVLRGGTEPMELLYADLDLRDSSQVADDLARQHIPYRLAANGSEILVPADKVINARLALAKDGLPSGGSVGYEIFDRSDGLAATEFQLQINETRALEGEIARTIQGMHGIRAARVHLVLPRREPFARDRQDAQAGVMLTRAGAARLDNESIQAILNLVAAAVPGLRPQNITIVDSRRNLLARAGQPIGEAVTALSAEEVRRATEVQLSRAVEEMLEHSLGPGHVRAEAAVRMSFDRINETQERYDPDSLVTRSTQTVGSMSKSTEPTAAVTVQNNLPNASAGQQGAGSQEAHQEETTNYEISKTVRTLIKDQPQIDRINLAVMVDGTDTVDADGKHSWQQRSAEELGRITNLVKTAIGYDEKRGDHVEVVSMRFAAEEAASTADNGSLMNLRFEKSDILRLAQTALFGSIGVLALLLVLRPMVLRITAVAPAALASDATILASLGGSTGPPAQPARLGQAALVTAAGPPLLEDESMVNIAQIEGQMRASSLRRIGELVEKHPEETLSIVRGWMVQENS